MKLLDEIEDALNNTPNLEWTCEYDGEDWRTGRTYTTNVAGIRVEANNIVVVLTYEGNSITFTSGPGRWTIDASRILSLCKTEYDKTMSGPKSKRNLLKNTMTNELIEHRKSWSKNG